MAAHIKKIKCYCFLMYILFTITAGETERLLMTTFNKRLSIWGCYVQSGLYTVESPR